MVTTSIPTPTTQLNHLYGYADQNPLSVIDPLGLFGCPPGTMAVPMRGNEKDFPKIALCQPVPGRDPEEKICVTAECAAGIAPSRQVCCDNAALADCLATKVSGSLPCFRCTTSRGQDRLACAQCARATASAASCFSLHCGSNKCECKP
jgi:hypothetical protein